MKKLVLLGGSDQAKVVFNALNDKANFVGFIDVFNNPDFLCLEYRGYKLIGDLNDLKLMISKSDYQGIVCYGENSFRKKIFEEFCREIDMINVIHESSILQSNIKIGHGNYIGPGVVINNDVSIGDNSIVNTRVVIEHDCEIGNHVHIAPGAVVSGNVKIGNGTFVGAGAVIIDDIKIGENAVVGAGAVVINDVSANSTVVGVPAKVIRKEGFN